VKPETAELIFVLSALMIFGTLVNVRAMWVTEKFLEYVDKWSDGK